MLTMFLISGEGDIVVIAFQSHSHFLFTARLLVKLQSLIVLLKSQLPPKGRLVLR